MVCAAGPKPILLSGRPAFSLTEILARQLVLLCCDAPPALRRPAQAKPAPPLVIQQPQCFSMDDLDEPTPAPPAVIPFTEPPLAELDVFARKYDRYPHCIVTVYQIIRDLHIKQELVELTLVDAAKWGRKEYFIQGRARSTGKLRLLTPFYLDAEIDLPWLTKLSLEFTAIDKDQELYLCIHTPESIIYEMVTTELP